MSPAIAREFGLKIAEWDFKVRDTDARPTDADGAVIESCTIVTLPASPKIAEIHNEKQRQPVKLHAEDHEPWLTGTLKEAKAVIRHYPDELIEAEAVIAGRFTGIEQPQSDLF